MGAPDDPRPPRGNGHRRLLGYPLAGFAAAGEDHPAASQEETAANGRASYGRKAQR